MTWKVDGRARKTTRHLFYILCQALCIISKPSANSNCSYSPEAPNLSKNPPPVKIWQMTLKNNRAHLLGYFKLCVSLHGHLSIQIGVTVRKRQIWVKIGEFLSRVTLKFDAWHWKTIGHLFYALSGFVHYFIAMCQFKMELQSGNAKFGSKSAFFVPCDLDI